jgi:16S rRNA (uracil1498-N3)-methyltransferase
MSIPFFYFPRQLPDRGSVVLNEESSKHIVQVLRMKTGEQVKLANGLGQICTAEITLEHKKNTEVNIIASERQEKPLIKSTIGISLVKNTSRFEWFLEKATELGITSIIPLLCTRTEKQHFRHDRMKNILVSAMLQSQQAWMPELSEPLPFVQVINEATQELKMIAHCLEEKKSSLREQLHNNHSSIILIGPEGDFTKEEISQALEQHFLPVTLGETRLRTETAGVAAAVLLKLA